TTSFWVMASLICCSALIIESQSHVLPRSIATWVVLVAIADHHRIPTTSKRHSARPAMQGLGHLAQVVRPDTAMHGSLKPQSGTLVVSDKACNSPCAPSILPLSDA